MHKKQKRRKCAITRDKKDGGWNQEPAANWWQVDCWSIGLQCFDLWRIWFCSSGTKNEVKQVYFVFDFHLQYDTRLSAQHSYFTFYELRSVYVMFWPVRQSVRQSCFSPFLFCFQRNSSETAQQNFVKFCRFEDMGDSTNLRQIVSSKFTRKKFLLLGF